MRFSKLISLSLVLGIVLASCVNVKKADVKDSQYQSIEKYFKTKHNYCIAEKISKLVIISQNGCPGCNKSFANFTLNSLVNDSTIILVTSNGTGIDLSEFRRIKDNVFFDENVNNSEVMDLFSNSGVIFLSSQKVDTIITIDASSLNEQFSETQNR
jgi:hypothetical protein